MKPSREGNLHSPVEFENGSTAPLGERSRLLFHQLALDADGKKLNGLTFEPGYTAALRVYAFPQDALKVKSSVFVSFGPMVTFCS